MESFEDFVDRRRELRALEAFWNSRSPQMIPVTGRRRIGKTRLLERFAEGKRIVYYRCKLLNTSEQLPMLGQALAALADDPFITAQQPASWPAIFALVERLAKPERLLLVLDELPYWVAKDPSLPSTIQNWWDERGRYLNLMFVICGSAVAMMERLLRGEAPLAGCTTGRMALRPLDFQASAQLLGFEKPVDNLTAYCILGGVPLYQTFFDPKRTIKQNILEQIATPTSRLYVEPQALFAAHHLAFEGAQALDVLRAIARGEHQWSKIADAAKIVQNNIGRVMEPLLGDMALVERVLPVTEQHATRTYFTQYHLTDNFLRFWFRFIEPNQGHIEFGDNERVVDQIVNELPTELGLPFEALCRDWVRLASAEGRLRHRVGAVGTWWTANHQLDVVGLGDDRAVAVVGECRFRNEVFSQADLLRYLGHVSALGRAAIPRPDMQHLLFSKRGFSADVQAWAAENGALLLQPPDLF
ncbi:MAG TPA: ATP-binding protein [Chloroflexota bacterium]|nr:ATP-binding protein [Chloroflexota bacterium]